MTTDHALVGHAPLDEPSTGRPGRRGDRLRGGRSAWGRPPVRISSSPLPGKGPSNLAGQTTSRADADNLASSVGALHTKVPGVVHVMMPHVGSVVCFDRRLFGLLGTEKVLESSAKWISSGSGFLGRQARGGRARAVWQESVSTAVHSPTSNSNQIRDYERRVEGAEKRW